MANNYYDGTGVLVLDKVTPIISALFGGYNLDASYPGDGEAYIALVAEDNRPNWEGVAYELLELAEELNIEIVETEEPEIKTVLEAFASFYGAADHPDLANLIKDNSFEQEADLEELFLIASCFNDGHNLTAIRFEGCWHADKARLFEFGGNSLFISQSFNFSGDTTSSLGVFTRLYRALTDGELDAAAVEIANETTRRLAGVADDEMRTTLTKRVAGHLAQLPSSPR